jgi:hypothetical protein
MLGVFTTELGSRSVAAVREGLGDLGWHEGPNIHFELRYASGKLNQLEGHDKDLVFPEPGGRPYSREQIGRCSAGPPGAPA